MSEHGGGVHMHAPHEEIVEHGAHGGHEAGGLTQKVALTTAVLATIGALFGYYSGKSATEAMMAKNDSIALWSFGWFDFTAITASPPPSTICSTMAF